MRKFLLIFNLAALAASPAFARDPQAEVGAVVEQFRTAIIAKDAAALRALFLPGHDSWFSVNTEVEHGRRLLKNPAAPRVHPGTSTQFAQSISRDGARAEEKFENVKIHADDSIASVHFDYVFLSNGKPTNHGQEAWQLIHTDDGWKIVSLVYSYDTGGAP
jgi:hypothetical protein